MTNSRPPDSLQCKISENELAGCVVSILTGKLAPQQCKKSEKWYLDLGPVAVESDELPHYNVLGLVDLAQEALEPYVVEDGWEEERSESEPITAPPDPAAEETKAPSPVNPRLVAALDYAERRGWEIFPAPPGEKKSYKSAKHSGGAKWGKTRDPKQIRRDFRRWPQANVGIPTGKDNGFWVLETDTPKGHNVDGNASLRALEEKHGPLPETLMAESPSGSRHRYFNQPNGLTIINSASGIAPGIDVRGEGGMVIAPPSVRGDGAYRWLNDHPIADAPQWLIDLASNKQLNLTQKSVGNNDSESTPKFEVAPGLEHLDSNEDLGEGLEGLPPLPFAPIKEGCPWLRHVHDTGGIDQHEPLWKLALNCCTFLEEGERLIHELGNRHSSYNVKATEEKFARARADKQTQNLGWPRCQTICNNGSTHCKACPHLAAGGSPLHLALYARKDSQEAADAPYRKDEIDEAIALGRTILIVKSKEDADYLWSIGIPATRNANGYFKDADIVVHESARAACQHLFGITKRVRILYLAEHAIFSDYTREQLDELIEHAPDYAPAASSLGEWDAGDEPGFIPPRQWLLGNQFCRGFISSIVAAGGAGKSALRLLQFISLATSRSLCGQHVFRRCRVLLISLEDDRDELQRRIKAVLDHYGIERKELKGWLFCASPKLAKLAEMKNRTRAIGPLEQHIRDAIKRRNPDIVSLDPFIKTHGLEENDSGDMDFVCDLLARMAIEFNIAVDSPHHAHKGQVTPGDADSGRGSSGIRDAGRLVYTLAPMSEADAKIFNINAESRRTYVRLDSAKVNIAAPSAKAEWFHIIGQPIGNSTDEYPNGDTIQVVEPWAPPDAWRDTTPIGLNAILTDIDRGLTDENGNPTGQRYSNAPKAANRAVWPVIQKHYPNKSEAECRTIIHAWLANELLYPDDYTDPVTRKSCKGLKVDSSKRPS